MSTKPPVIKGSSPSNYGWGRLPQIIQFISESIVSLVISYFIYDEITDIDPFTKDPETNVNPFTY
jgi:hypothetical protein